MSQNEVTQMLLCPDPAAAVIDAASTGRLAELLPEVDAFREMATEGLHKDVYLHSLQVLRHAVEFEPGGPDLVLRLAALLHDIGKPDTRQITGNKVTFVDHEHVGAKMARQRLRTLGYPVSTARSVAGLVSLHMRLHGYGDSDWTDAAVRRLLRRAGPQIDRLLVLMRSDVTSKKNSRQNAMRRMYDHFESRVSQVRAADAKATVRPELSGVEVMDILGWEPGSRVGDARRFLLQLRADEGLLGKDEATRRLREWENAGRT